MAKNTIDVDVLKEVTKLIKEQQSDIIKLKEQNKELIRVIVENDYHGLNLVKQLHSLNNK